MYLLSSSSLELGALTGKKYIMSVGVFIPPTPSFNLLSLKSYSLEEWHDLAGQFLSLPEALRVEHDLGDELSVRLGHGQTAEQLLQVVREVGAASIARVHGDEDGHVWVDPHLTVDQLHCHGGTWQTEMNVSDTLNLVHSSKDLLLLPRSLDFCLRFVDGYRK